MPIYLFAHPETGEQKEVVLRMTEPHVFIADGVEWKRVFTSPTYSIDTKIDPFSTRDFVDKTGKKKGTMGDIFDASKEASEKREKVLGKDPVKEKYYKDYSDKRGGRPHPSTLSKDVTIEI